MRNIGFRVAVTLTATKKTVYAIALKYTIIYKVLVFYELAKQGRWIYEIYTQ